VVSHAEKRKQIDDAREQKVEALVGPYWYEVNGGKKCKLHTEYRHDACSTPHAISEMKSKSVTMAGQVGHTGRKMNSFRVLERKPEEGYGVQGLVFGRITLT
jgi:hypothetical protein